MISIKIVNNSNNPNPNLGSAGSAGADLRAFIKNDKIILKSMERKLIPTGIKMEIPVGYEVQIRPRSGLAIKNGIASNWKSCFYISFKFNISNFIKTLV